MILTLLGRTARSLLRQLTAGIFLFLILDVFIRVKSQCLTACIGQSIKTVNVTTGECISCFPCPECQAGYSTSSVPCGTTVPFGTDINCVLIPPDPVVVSKASAQTRHLTSTPLTITSSSKQLIVTPVTSNVHPVVVPATSSSAPAGSSMKQRPWEGSETIHKPKGEKVLPLGEYSKWKKHTMIYIFSAICLLIALVAIVWRLSKKKRFQIHIVRQPENPEGLFTSPVQPCRSDISHSQDREICNINLATNSVAFSRTNHSGHDTSETRHDNQNFQPGAMLASPDGNAILSTPIAAAGRQLDQDNHNFKGPDTPSWLAGTTKDPQTLTNAAYINILVQTPKDYMVFQPHTPVSWPQSLVNNERNGPITEHMGQGKPVSWSTLSQREKYNTKVLEMPFPVLYKICLLLDILRADGNDVRMLAHKLGVSVGDLALLKQAVINAQSPDNFNSISTSHVVLSTKPSGTVGDFVDIMKEIGRDDIVSVINN